MFTGFYNKKIYQFSCFKAIHEISALLNYNASVSGRRCSLYQEVYLSIETKNLYKHVKCNFVQSLDKETAKRP